MNSEVGTIGWVSQFYCANFGIFLQCKGSVAGSKGYGRLFVPKQSTVTGMHLHNPTLYFCAAGNIRFNKETDCSLKIEKRGQKET